MSIKKWIEKNILGLPNRPRIYNALNMLVNPDILRVDGNKRFWDVYDAIRYSDGRIIFKGDKR